MHTTSQNKFSLFTLALAFALAGCGSEQNTTESNRSESFSYELTLNGCSTGRQTFSSREAMCSALRDDGRNRDCARSLREDHFKKNCPGQTWEEPAPVPAPQPNPQPNPQPQPAPVPEPKKCREIKNAVVCDLEEAGIQVKITPNTHPRIPGEPSFQELLREFWKSLEAVKTDILSRKEQFQQINITSWTSYDTKSGYLNLAVEMKAADLRGYLVLNDSRIDLESELGMRFELGVEIHGHERDLLADFRATLLTLKNYGPSLSFLKGAVKTISRDSYTNYTLYNRELQLDRDRFEQELAIAVRAFGNPSAVLAWEDEIGVEISGSATPIGSDVNPAKAEGFKKAIEALNANLSTLSMLRTQALLNEIKLEDYYSDFGLVGKTMNLVTAYSTASKNSEFIQSLGKLVPITTELEITFELPYDGVGLEFEGSVRRLEAVRTALLSKKGKIRKIKFADKSENMYGTLYVGMNDDEAALRRAIQSIQ